MSVELKTEWGSIDISDDVIATIAGAAALECYGLVGMASRQALKDGIIEMLGRNNLKRGIVVHRNNDKMAVDLHIIVSYGIRISEVAHNVQKRVKYTLKETTNLDIDDINIIVQGVNIT